MAQKSAREPDRSLLIEVGRYAAAQALVAISTLAALWVAARWGDAAVEMLYLPAVLAAGVWWGFGPAVLAAVTSALAYNFYFTAPVHTFRIDSPVDIVDVAILFVVAVVTSQLAAAIRRQARIAEAHASRNATIAGFSRKLLSGSSESEIARTAAHEVAALFGSNAVVVSGLPEPVTLAPTSGAPALTPADIAAAVQTLRSGEIAGHGASSLAPAEWQFRPIRSDREVLAALGMARDDGSTPISEEQALLLDSLLDQTALALCRARDPGPASRQAASA